MNIIFKNYINLSTDESEEILNLRNSDFVRFNMKNTELINKNNHFNWIETLKENNQKEHFAIIVNEEIQGAVSWTKENDGRVFWGIFCNKNSNPIVSSMSAYLFIDYLFYKKLFIKIYSYVKVENNSALKFNQAFGFTKTLSDKEFSYLELSKETWEQEANSKSIRAIKKYSDKIFFKLY